MKSNILLITALSFSLGVNSAYADETKINHNEAPKSSSLSQKTQNTLQGISDALKHALQPFPKEVLKALDDTQSEIIVLESESKMGLREIRNPELVKLDNIDTGPNLIIKIKLRGVKPANKKFKNAN